MMARSLVSLRRAQKTPWWRYDVTGRSLLHIHAFEMLHNKGEGAWQS